MYTGTSKIKQKNYWDDPHYLDYMKQEREDKKERDKIKFEKAKKEGKLL